MTAHELKQQFGIINREQDAELDRVEKEVSSKYRQQRRDLFKAAGEQVSMMAGLEDAYYDFFPPKSDIPDNAALPLAEFD